MNQGWNPYDDEAQMLAIQSWVSVLDSEKVPPEAYAELYEWALKTRAMAIQSGRSIPNFGVELLLAGWIGESGLQSEYARRLRESMVAERRYLTTQQVPNQTIVSPAEGLKIMEEILAKRESAKI